MGLLARIGITRGRVLLGTGIGAAAWVAIDGPSDVGSKLSFAGNRIADVWKNPHQAWFGVKNLHRFWFLRESFNVSETAQIAEAENFGRPGNIDTAGDAFRHAYASGLLTLRAMRDHGMDQASAGALVVAAGAAHERDGTDNTSASADMDRANNQLGVDIVGDGRSDTGWMSELELEQAVLDALEGGRLVVVSD